MINYTPNPKPRKEGFFCQGLEVSIGNRNQPLMFHYLKKNPVSTSSVFPWFSATLTMWYAQITCVYDFQDEEIHAFHS